MNAAWLSWLDETGDAHTWECEHAHRRREEAARCAVAEIRSRFPTGTLVYGLHMAVRGYTR